MINMYSLKYFYDSCRLKSMTKAAELNHVSRPAISQAIKKLEEDLNISLLNHKRREIEPTSSGLLLIKEAESIFEKLETTYSMLKDNSKGKLYGTLRIGSVRTLAAFKLHGAIRSFREEHENVEIKIQVRRAEETVQKLINREIDIALFLGEDLLPGYKYTILKKGHFCLVKPKGKKNIQYAVTQPRPEVQNLKTIFEMKFGNSLPLFAEISSWDAILSWVQKGICGGLLPDFLFETRESKKNISVVLDKVWPYEIKAMVSTAKANDPIVKTFIEKLIAD
ncbi:MAG: LysR family transcriptional regulator [Bdellovibrionota bacterium]